MDIARNRREYVRGTLTADQVGSDPFVLFKAWFEVAAARDQMDANAMVLATVRTDDTPDVRVVLLKAFDHDGFVFYTDQRSAKGVDLAAHPVAALCFYWSAFDRQVRIRGRVAPVSADEADAYFATRPRDSQVGAWASTQSVPLADRQTLEQRVAEATARFGTGHVPRPPYWGGYRVMPDEMEFWQGRVSRLHDRFRFRQVDDEWQVERLAP